MTDDGSKWASGNDGYQWASSNDGSKWTSGNDGAWSQWASQTTAPSNGSGQHWYWAYPQFLYRNNRTDLSDLAWVKHWMHDEPRGSASWLRGAFNEVTNGHKGGIRNPFLVLYSLESAVYKKERGAKSWKCKYQGGYVVRLNVWQLAVEEKLCFDDLLDISSEEKQKALFGSIEGGDGFRCQARRVFDVLERKAMLDRRHGNC